MLMEKFFQGMKLRMFSEHRGDEQVSDHVSAFFSQNLLANSMDDSEPVCRFHQGGHVPMYKL